MSAIRISCFAAAIAFAAVTSAVEPAPADGRLRTADASPTGAEWEPLPLGAGLRVFIDPATGQFRKPTAAELESIAASARASKNKSSEGLEVVYRPDGSKHVDLQGRFMHALRVKVNEDGSTSYVCSDRTHDHSKPAAAPSAPADR